MTATLVSPRADTAIRSDRQSVAPRTFRPDVEGLRAVAVAIVVLYHAGLPWLPGGYVGVDVFFVISGYLITGLLLREFDRTGRLSLADFYARRARRILPLASLVLVATLAASAIVLGSTRLTSIAHDGLWTAVFGANVHFADVGANYLNATAPPSPLQHYWSLAVEEQFYLVWPALLWLVLSTAKRIRAGWLAAVVTTGLLAASLIWSVSETTHNANTSYFSPFTRAWELGAGALVAVCAVGMGRLPRFAAVSLGWIGAALIAYSAVHFDARTAFPGSAAAVPVAGAALILVAGIHRRRGGVEEILSTKPMQLLGQWSYSLYLWHWPILIITLGRYPHLSPAVRALLVVASVAVSALSYRLFENPVRHSARLVNSPRLSITAGLLAIVCTLSYSYMFVVGQQAVANSAAFVFATQNSESATGGTLASSADIVQAVAAGAGQRSVPSPVSPPLTLAAGDQSPAYGDGCLVAELAVKSPSCVFGDTTSTQTVVLFGDSHAAQWMPALQNSASRAKFKLVVLTKGNCPAPTVTVYHTQLKRAFTECDTWRAAALARIAQLHPALVVMSSTFHGVTLPGGQPQSAAAEAAWEQGMDVTLKRLEPAAGRVVVVGDVPNHASSVPDCLEQYSSNTATCASTPAHAILQAHQTAEMATVRAAGATYLDVVPWFCTQTTCPAIVHATVTDFDDSHLTATYSKYLGHAFGQALGLEK